MVNKAGSGYFLICFVVWILTGSCDWLAKQDEKSDYTLYFNRLDTMMTAEKAMLLNEWYNALQADNPGLSNWIRYYKLKADYYCELGDFTHCFALLDSIELKTANDFSNKEWGQVGLSSLLLKADCYEGMGRINEAITALTRAKALDIQLHGSGVRFSYDSRIADLYFKQGRFHVSINYFKKALHETQNSQNDMFRTTTRNQRILSCIARSYRAIGAYDSAGLYFLKAIDYIEKSKGLFASNKETAMCNSAVLYLELGELKRKFGAVNDAQKRKKATANLMDVNQHLPYVGPGTLVADQHPAEADFSRAQDQLAALNQYHNEMSAKGIKVNRSEWYRAMADLSAARGDTVQAYNYRSAYIVLQDSVAQIRKAGLMGWGSIGLPAHERDFGKEPGRHRSSAHGLFIATILLLIFVSAVAVFYLRRKSIQLAALQKLNKEVTDRENYLQQAYATLEQHHLHRAQLLLNAGHDLKNPIGGIRIISRSLLNKEADQCRRESLSLICNASQNALQLIDELLVESVPAEKETDPIVLTIVAKDHTADWLSIQP